MANEIMGPQLQAQQDAIRMFMQKKQMEADTNRWNQRIEEMRIDRQREDQQRAMKLKADAQAARVKYLQGMAKTTYEKGDQAGYNKFSSKLSDMGFTVADHALPQEDKNLPGSPAAALARMYKDDPQKLMALFNKQHQKSGMRLDVGPDGNITLVQGPDAESMQLTKPQMSKIQEKAINANEGLKRLEGIVRSFKPEYLQIPSRIGAEWTALKSKLNMGEIGEKDQEFLEDFSIFKQNALENINLYIKEITGAQMSEKEADRIRKAMPDPGEGVFGGDSPPEFRKKLINSYKKAKASLARYNYYLKMGIPETTVSEMINSNTAVSLDEIENIIEKRAKELEKENPKADMKQIATMIAKEFGL